MQNVEFEKGGAAKIQNAITEACANGSRQTVITGNYEIEKTVLIPGDFTLILENCHLVMADGTYCNMFTNENCRTEKGRTAEGCDRNIIIEGRGRAILDGGKYNGLSEQNHSKDGRPHISVNNILLFVNVEHFKISGLHVRNQRWWALDFFYCRFGRISEIDFLSDCTMISEDGTRVLGLSRTRFGGYGNVYIKNSDGIDLRVGCHDIIIENITGVTEDDTVALTAIPGELSDMFAVEGLSSDLYNVIIRNVNAAAFCAIVRLLNQGGIKLYNILVDGVFDASKDSPYLDRGESGVRVGDTRSYGGAQSAPDETYNITIRNVVTRAFASMRLAGSIRNLTVDNVSSFDGGGEIQNNADIYEE